MKECNDQKIRAIDSFYRGGGATCGLRQAGIDVITAVEVLNYAAYVGLEGLDQLMAVNMMGDGMRRYLNIVVAAANPMNNILLIDEIDNGLHYSAYKKLWEAIFALAISTNKQVFVTTHSKETLCRLNEMLEEHTDYQDTLRLYTIEKTKKKKVEGFRYTQIGNAIPRLFAEQEGRVFESYA